MGFYDSKRWLSLRESILRRDRYTCQENARFGKMREATTVHHIFPREEFPEYEWKPWNLISLTAEAHNMMHTREGELTAKGKDLLRRTARKNNVEIPERYK